MTAPLTLPAIGSTNWGTAVNNNWTWLNNAFTSTANFNGSVIIGSDPGGSALLRIGGIAFASSNLFAGFQSTAISYYPLAVVNSYAVANIPALAAFSNSNGGGPATSGSTQTAAALVVRFGVANVVLDFGVRSAGNVWLQTGFSSNLTTTFPIELNPVGGPVIVGADPGGANLLRVGGALTINDTKIMTTNTSFTNGAASSSPTLGATGPAGASTPTKWIPINDNGTLRYLPAW